MDSTQSKEEVTTEDVQAGVIRAIFKSRSHFKRFKDCIWPEPTRLGADGRQDRSRMDSQVPDRTRQS